MTSQEALSVMTSWVSAIADNVKNPIAGIAATLDQIETKLSQPEVVTSAIARIRERLESLNEYVSELSDFAKPPLIDVTNVAISALLRDSMRTAKLPHASRVEVVVAEGLKAMIDQAKIAMALKALLRNAVEAIGSDTEPRIRLSGCKNAAGDLILTVEDNGPGLDPKTITQAADPFFSTKEAGTGLGLTIVRKYVEGHGGKMALGRSQTLGGCRVDLLLPVSAPNDMFKL
jgi:nitrogen fixation/metabolism regulation signal transduction histidine kinase